MIPEVSNIRIENETFNDFYKFQQTFGICEKLNVLTKLEHMLYSTKVDEPETDILKKSINVGKYST